MIRQALLFLLDHSGPQQPWWEKLREIWQCVHGHLGKTEQITTTNTKQERNLSFRIKAYLILLVQPVLSSLKIGSLGGKVEKMHMEGDFWGMSNWAGLV